MGKQREVFSGRWERSDAWDSLGKGVKAGRLRKALEKAGEWDDGQTEHLEFRQETITQINRTKYDSCPYSFQGEILEAEENASVHSVSGVPSCLLNITVF